MRTRMRRIASFAALFVVGALAITGCTTTSDLPAETSDAPADVDQVLRYVPGIFPLSLDFQAYPAETNVQAAVQQVLETLVRFDDGEAQPLLAESWKNPDPLTWTFNLRAVNFSDGTPFTAEDVKASLDPVMVEGGPLAQLFALVTDTEAEDDHTFTITTSQPLGTLLSSLSLVSIGKAGGISDVAYWQAPIGTGPFVVEEYVADDHVDFVRNENYWGEKPLLERMTWLNMPEIASRVTALQTGEVDVLTTVPPDLSLIHI